MNEETPWWPLQLAGQEEEALAEFRRRMRGFQTVLAHGLVKSTADQLWLVMAEHLPFILERDTLPDLAHILGGWGDVSCGGHRGSERIVPFIHWDSAGRGVILQKDPEGEYHPWQTFAYAVMAGLDVDASLRPGAPSIRELAQTSRSLNTRDGCELGHLLFALAFLDPSLHGPAFSLMGNRFDPIALMESAVAAHYSGHFDVCRKFHLTQGICAMAVRVPGMESFRGYAQRFLDGQLDMMLLLAIIIEQADALSIAPSLASPRLLDSLRETLRIGTQIENHCYYAGHLIELACVADALGYEIQIEHRSAMTLIANLLNPGLSNCLPLLSFRDCFLHLGHYRRAITLLAESQRPRTNDGFFTPESLAAFTSTAEDLTPPNQIRSAGLSGKAYARYASQESAAKPRARFLEVVERYTALARPGLEPRGEFPHFRRIGPARWPRAMHYELLDYGDRIGVEIHLESDAVASLSGVLRKLAKETDNLRCGRMLEWDPLWYKQRGRVRILFEDAVPSDHVAEASSELIDRTFLTLDRCVPNQIGGSSLL